MGDKIFSNLVNDGDLETKNSFTRQVAEDDDDQLGVVDHLCLDVGSSDQRVGPESHDWKQNVRNENLRFEAETEIANDARENFGGSEAGS